MKLLKILLTFLFVNFCLLAQTAQNVQLLDTKLGAEIYTNPPWDPISERFGGGWGYTELSTGEKYYYAGNSRGFAAFNITDPANIQVFPTVADPIGVTHIKTYSSSRKSALTAWHTDREGTKGPCAATGYVSILNNQLM